MVPDETRKCNDCGEEWPDDGDPSCIFCGSMDTEILDDDSDDDWEILDNESEGDDWELHF